MKSLNSVARVLLFIVPVIACSIFGLIFGSYNGRVGNIRLYFGSLFNH